MTPTAIRDLFLLAVWSGIMAASGYGLCYHQVREAKLDAGPVRAPKLTVPSELKLTIGDPEELRGDTDGRDIHWAANEDELRLKSIGPKSCWVSGKRPGTYVVTSITCVDGELSEFQYTMVKVSEPAAEKKEAHSTTARKEDE